MLVERARSAGSENLTRLTRNMVDVCEAVGLSESNFRQADRYRVFGQEENARTAEQDAQSYNKAAISTLSDIVPSIISDLRDELEPVGGDGVEEAINNAQDSLHKRLVDFDVTGEDAERLYRESQESFDAIRTEGVVSACDLLSDRVAQLEELRRRPDRSMTRRSPDPVSATIAIIFVVVGAVVTTYCVHTQECGVEGSLFYSFLFYGFAALVLIGSLLFGGSERQPE
jgi:hypothetical protein